MSRWKEKYSFSRTCRRGDACCRARVRKSQDPAPGKRRFGSHN
jgi:hypothetical protein